MRRTSTLLLALVLAIVAGPGCAQDREPTPTPKSVIVVSIDGLRPDAIEKTETPTLHRLMEQGARAKVARTILPSATLPSHTSMLTGVVPKRHRVLWNSWDEGKGFIEAATCLAIARRSGYRTSMFVGKEKLRHLARDVEIFENPAYHAEKVARAAVEHLRRERRPSISFVHFSDPDGAGHAHGWLSEEQLEAIRDADRALGILVAALEESGAFENTVLILTADHGGHGKTHGTFMEEDMRIPWIAFGAGVKKGTAFDREVSTCDTAATALHVLGITPPADWDGKPVVEAFE